MPKREKAADFNEHVPQLIEETVAQFYRQHPELKTRYGAAGRQRCHEDIAYHYCVVSESLIAGDNNIFLKYIGWGKSVLANRNVRADDLVDCLLVMQERIAKRLENAGAQANECIQLAIDTFDSFAAMPPSCIDPSASLANIANAYLEALLSSDPTQARRVLESAEKMGVGFRELHQYVFQPVQREVGRLWQVNHITVAQEHYCTNMTERLMSEVRAKRGVQEGTERLFIGACVAGEQHAIGMRMVSEVLEADGWHVYFTGANTPTASLVDLVRRLNVHLLGISCATAMHLRTVRLAVEAIRGCSKQTRIMVGGRIFCDFPGLWKKVGADGFAEDAESAVRVASKLVGLKQADPARV